MKVVKPNLIHRLLHLMVSRRSLLAFFAHNMHRIDLYFLKLTGGKYSLSELGGWTIIQLTTTGAKTGTERTIPLLAGMEADKIALIASSFGRAHNPGWYYNLKTYPDCTVTFKGTSSPYLAREVYEDEYIKYWDLVASNYVGYEKYRKYAAHRHIPVLVLEPKK